MATDPVCGMFVDERTADLKLVRDNRTYYFCASSCLEEFASPERQLARLRVRLAVAWPLSLVVLALTYLGPFVEAPWVAAALATVVQFYPGLPFYRGTYDALRGRLWNMDVLIAVGTSVAYLYSFGALLLPARLPHAYFFDASSFIVTLILTGNYLEHVSRERARGSLQALRELLPARALVVRDGREVEVDATEVQAGDRVRVRPGSRFPADGVVVEGGSSVHEALLTGEETPVEKRPGDPVIAGAINGEGSLLVEARRVGSDTFLAQVGLLVAEAETSRVPLQRLADRIASVFVPLVLALALLSALAWFSLGAGPTVALLAFVSVAITACPCAFGIATPAALMVGTGSAADEGVLFKGRDSLEQASRVDLVLLDKTGTLTRGVPTVAEVLPAAGVGREVVLALAGGLEQRSEHPLGRAVVEEVRDRGISPETVHDVVARPGVGVAGEAQGHRVAILRGSEARRTAGDLGALASAADVADRDGKSWSVVLRDDRPLGLLVFSHEIALGAKDSLAALGRDGIGVAMVTGDHGAAARRVAAELGISEVHADLLPDQKLALIRALEAKGRHVAYVGDGINDAPALAAADLGIAIGSGTDVAREAGGVVLVRSDLRGVPYALRVGRQTVRKVRGNLAWALGYNAVLLPVAAGALVPVLGLRVFQALPIAGALAMGLSSTTVVLNSLSLRRTLRSP